MSGPVYRPDSQVIKPGEVCYIGVCFDEYGGNLFRTGGTSKP
jgi:hypothetical protein